MNTDTSTRHDLYRRSLDEALRARGGYSAKDYGLFWTSVEGTFLPISTPDQEVEETSGYLVDGQGRHFLFWFAWDEQKGSPAITIWQQTESQPDWFEDEEYLAARREAGLPP